MLTRRLALGAAFAAIAFAGTAQAQSWKAAYPELVLAVVPAENASGVTERYAPFVEYLAKELGTKVTLRVANDYAAVIEGQRNGSIQIAGYGPASFPTTVVLKGSHFTGALTVLFGDVPAMSFAVVSDSVINATSPGGPAEVVDVTVTGAGGTSTVSAADQFSYLGAPVIFTVSPATGKAGTVVTLTGASFTRAYGISFGDASVLTGNFTVVSDSEITVTAPTNDLPGSVGDVTIAVTTPIGLSNGAKFTYD